jgi:hypothetical protein
MFIISYTTNLFEKENESCCQFQSAIHNFLIDTQILLKGNQTLPNIEFFILSNLPETDLPHEHCENSLREKEAETQYLIYVAFAS